MDESYYKTTLLLPFTFSPSLESRCMEDTLSRTTFAFYLPMFCTYFSSLMCYWMNMKKKHVSFNGFLYVSIFVSFAHSINLTWHGLSRRSFSRHLHFISFISFLSDSANLSLFRPILEKRWLFYCALSLSSFSGRFSAVFCFLVTYCFSTLEKWPAPFGISYTLSWAYYLLLN